MVAENVRAGEEDSPTCQTEIQAASEQAWPQLSDVTEVTVALNLGTWLGSHYLVFVHEEASPQEHLAVLLSDYWGQMLILLLIAAACCRDRIPTIHDSPGFQQTSQHWKAKSSTSCNVSQAPTANKEEHRVSWQKDIVNDSVSAVGNKGWTVKKKRMWT